MSAPPPGYNPEDTVIQGGTAPITPMAGGGAAPPGYNPDETVIQGGTTPITPMAGGADAAAAAAAAAAPTAQQAQIALDQEIQNLSEQQKQQVETLMKTAFEEYMFVYGLNDIEAGRKTEEEAGLDAARASITAGTQFVSSLLEQRVTVPKEISYYPEESEKQIEFPEIVSGNSDIKAPRLEYYRIQESQEGLTGFDSLIRFITANYQSKDWKKTFLEKLASYEKRRLQTFWDTSIQVSNSNSNTKNARIRAPTIPSLLNAKNGNASTRMPLMDRATLQLSNSDCNIVAIPAIRGDAKRFLNTLYTLEKLNIIATVKAKDQNRPKVLVKKSVVLVFMPPFFTLELNEDKSRENITLYSLYLEIEQYNQGKVFMIPDHTKTNYEFGRMINVYRNTPKGTLVNFLDPSYIYFKRDETATPIGALLSGAADGEVSIQLSAKDAENKVIPKVFRPTAGGNVGGYVVIRTSNGPDVTKPEQLSMPKSPSAAGDCEGLLFNTVTFDKDVPPKPIQLIDTNLEGKDVSVLLVIRFKYTENVPICSASTSRLIQIPKPPDIFYGSSRADTKGVPTKTLVLTEEDEYLQQADTKPIFQVRIPKDSNEVLEDWYSGIYTEDEANFLNSMGLKPDVLKDIYKEDVYTNWKVEVAQFLNGLVVSNCYSDTEMSGLLLSIECQQNRNFLDRVRTHYIEKGITAEKLQIKHNDQIQSEFNRYLDEVKSVSKAASTAEFNTSGFTIQEVSGSEYLSRKKVMGSLYVDYIYTKEATPPPTHVGTYFMAVQREKPPAFYEIRVPINEYSGNPRIFYESITTLKERNPSFTILY